MFRGILDFHICYYVLGNTADNPGSAESVSGTGDFASKFWGMYVGHACSLDRVMDHMDHQHAWSTYLVTKIR